MRIDFIHLQNYRPYLNEKITFSSDEENENLLSYKGLTAPVNQAY